jgi:hypothetical protein
MMSTPNLSDDISFKTRSITSDSVSSLGKEVPGQQKSSGMFLPPSHGKRRSPIKSTTFNSTSLLFSFPQANDGVGHITTLPQLSPDSHHPPGRHHEVGCPRRKLLVNRSHGSSIPTIASMVLRTHQQEHEVRMDLEAHLGWPKVKGVRDVGTVQ